MNEFELEHVLIDMFNRMKSNINARPLNLGGIAGSGGGIGGPPGGFTGYLPQTRVSYDLSELATMEVPISGASLVDNLNRIRSRIVALEETGGGLSSQILQFHNGIITEYLPTASGLTSALANSMAKDIIIFPPQTIISGIFTLPAGTTLKGTDWSSEISGTLNLSPNVTGFSSVVEDMQFTPGSENYCLQVAVASVYQEIFEFVRNCRFVTNTNKYCVNLEITWGDWTDITFIDCIFDTLGNPSYVFKESSIGNSLTAEVVRSVKWGTNSMKWSDISASFATYSSHHSPEITINAQQPNTYALRTIVTSGSSGAYHIYSTNDLNSQMFSVNNAGAVKSRGGYNIISSAGSTVPGVYGIINNVESITTSGLDITVINQNPTISGGIVTDFGAESSQILNLGIKVYDNDILESSEIQELNFINSNVTVSGKVATISGGVGSMDFLGLTDTPNTYSGQANKFVSVNSGETGLEFTTLSGIVDSTAIHSNISGEIASITEKLTPVDNDITIIEDSAAGNAKKRVSWTNIKATLKSYFDTLYAALGHTHAPSGGADTTAIHNNVSGEIYVITTKSVPVNLDTFIIEDSAAANIKKKVFWNDIFGTLKSGFDSIYINFTQRGAANGVASLNANTKVVENPASASATPAASTIPITGADGKLDAWITRDGWVSAGATWTYASVSTFTISGDVTAIYQKGTFLRWKQGGGWKYGVVASSAYVAPNTTVTIIVNTNYTIANAAITDNGYSYMANPAGFPHWFNWTPTITGYSVLPTGAVYRFRVIGRTVFFEIREATTGTSNAADATYTPPVSSGAGVANLIFSGTCIFMDNGINSPTFGRWTIDGNTGGNIIFGINAATAGGFTASGNKRIAAAQGFYEF